ncbi:MAG: hypothetical protein WC934_02920 [Acidithiobacillus sp.]|jgi:hypothetical protein|uniref:hypothetical protein n=1 Tax=Acidithiobacillus sp. TaxID=1872118 RepID=UPI003560C925
MDKNIECYDEVMCYSSPCPHLQFVNEDEAFIISQKGGVVFYGNGSPQTPSCYLNLLGNK